MTPAAGDGPRRPPRPPRPSQGGRPPSTAPRPSKPPTTSKPPKPPKTSRPPKDPKPPKAAKTATTPGSVPSKVRFRDPAPTQASPAAMPAAPGPPAEPEHHETPTGRLRRIRAERTATAAELLPAQEASRSAFRRRYGNPYDTQGPKVRMGALWAIAVVAVLAPQSLRPWGLAVLFGVVAGAASAQIIDAHRGDHQSFDRILAAFAGSTLPVAATLGTQALGAGYVILVATALIACLARPEKGRPVLARAGHVVGAAGVCGGAAASLVLLAEYEIGALIILLVFVMVYDASDFIVGSGASNGIEGPLAGALFIAAASSIFAVVNAPPFRGVDIWSFSVLAMIACPAGQILASGLLPDPRADAPALRRLDAYLVVAPAWAGLVGLYLAQV